MYCDGVLIEIIRVVLTLVNHFFDDLGQVLASYDIDEFRSSGLFEKSDRGDMNIAK